MKNSNRIILPFICLALLTALTTYTNCSGITAAQNNESLNDENPEPTPGPTEYNSFLYLVGFDGLKQFSVDSGTKLITNLGNITGLPSVSYRLAIAADPLGKFVFATAVAPNQGSFLVETYTVNQTTGALTYASSTTIQGRFTYALAVDPTGRFIFAQDNDDQVAISLSINRTTGQTTLVTRLAAQVSAGTYTYVGFSPTGAFAFLYGGGSINSFSLSGTGALTAGPTTAGAGTHMHVSSTGKFAFVAASDGPTLRSYAINPATGAMSANAAVNTNAVNTAELATDPEDKFLFVVGNSGTSIMTFSLDSVGAVTQGPKLALSEPGNAPSVFAMVMDPTSTMLYAGTRGGNRIHQLSFEPATGILTEGPLVQAGMNQALQMALIKIPKN